MYVAITGKGKAKVIQFCEQHRIPKTNKKKTVVIKTIGNYETLLKENPNIIEELKEEAKRLTIEKKEKTPKTNLFRFGHSLVNALWKELSLDEILGENLSKSLFALVIYRLGSSYSTFLENRKTPFISLNSLSHSEFYDVLLQLDKKTKDLIKCFNKFFDKKIKRDKNIVYYHRGNYIYNSYWKVLYGLESNNFQKGEKDLPFNMNLFFDSYGIPISYHLSLKEDNSKNKLEDFKKNFKNSKLILVLTKESEIQEKGSISSISFEDLSEDIKNEILALESKQNEINAEIQQAENEKILLTNSFTRDTQEALRQADEQIKQFVFDQEKYAERQKTTEIKAPVTGSIQQLSVHTIGGVVTAAQPLMIVVPKQDKLEVNAMINNQEIGFIHQGQEATIKVEAFPYTRYGYLTGKVKSISFDAIENEKVGLVFSAIIELDKDYLVIDNHKINLTAGMTVNAEIKTGRRSVMSYLLSPLQSTVSESFRER